MESSIKVSSLKLLMEQSAQTGQLLILLCMDHTKKTIIFVETQQHQVQQYGAIQNQISQNGVTVTQFSRKTITYARNKTFQTDLTADLSTDLSARHTSAPAQLGALAPLARHAVP